MVPTPVTELAKALPVVPVELLNVEHTVLEKARKLTPLVAITPEILLEDPFKQADSAETVPTFWLANRVIRLLESPLPVVIPV